MAIGSNPLSSTRQSARVHDCLVEHNEKVAVGQRQAIMGPAAEGGRPVAVNDELGIVAVGDIDHDQAGIAPGDVSRVVMEAVAS
jgi:hypothetical protein